jgi:hypothetical protein
LGVGFDTVAVHEMRALAPAADVGADVGVGRSDDGAESRADDVVDVPDGEEAAGEADPGATADLVDGVRLAQAAVSASATSTQPRLAARARDDACDRVRDRPLGPRAMSIGADATPHRRRRPGSAVLRGLPAAPSNRNQ